MAPSHVLEYSYDDFVAACGEEGRNVFVWESAAKDAEDDFGLSNVREIKKFIADGGLQDVRFINSKPLEKGSKALVGKLFDAYTFHTGVRRRGYVAFCEIKDRGKWHVKSFHKDEHQLVQNPFAEKLQNFLVDCIGDKNED